MPIHFPPEELAARRERAIATLRSRGLHALLLFRQESMYYLAGYDTFGYVFFQCMVLGADGSLTLVTRSPDVELARYTSVVEDVRVWVDGPDADPARTDLLPVLEERGLRDRRLGVEWDAYGLTAHEGRRLAAALDGFCDLEDASDVVTRMRAVKSAAEIEHVRRAAALADDALERAVHLARPGVHVDDVLAEMQATVFRGGGDYPGNEFILGSGPSVRCTRYQCTRHRLGDDDTLAIEHAGVYRRYHACLFRSLKIGRANPRHEALYEVARDGLEAAREKMRPGCTFGDVFAAYDAHLARHGRGGVRRNACGYGLGATFAPNWMDWPMFYRDNPEPILPGMTLFYTGGVQDPEANLFGVCGETVLVTESGPERLSRLSLDYVRLA